MVTGIAFILAVTSMIAGQEAPKAKKFEPPPRTERQLAEEYARLLTCTYLSQADAATIFGTELQNIVIVPVTKTCTVRVKGGDWGGCTVLYSATWRDDDNYLRTGQKAEAGRTYSEDWGRRRIIIVFEKKPGDLIENHRCRSAAVLKGIARTVLEVMPDEKPNPRKPAPK